MAIPAHKTEYFIIENSILQKKANTAWSTGNLLATATAENTAGYYTVNASANTDSPITVRIFSEQMSKATSGTTIDTTGNNYYVGAVEAASETGIDATGRSKVLKYKNTYLDGTTAKYFVVNLLGPDADLSGKVAIVESDIYIPTNVYTGEVQLPTLNGNANFTNMLASEAGFTLQRYGRITAQTGVYDTSTDRSANTTYVHKMAQLTQAYGQGSWHKLKMVYTDKGSAVSTENPDTWRVYVDGVLLEGSFLKESYGEKLSPTYDFESRAYNYNKGTTESAASFKSYNMNSIFNGILIGGKGQANPSPTETNANLYFDNISVKTLDTKFALESVEAGSTNAFNAENNVIKLYFNLPVDAESVKNIKLVDASGDEVNAIKSTEFTDGNTELHITLDSDKIAGNTEYKVILPATVTDIYGQGLVTYYTPYRSTEAAKGDTKWYNTTVPTSSDKLAITVKTAKSGEIFIDDVTDGYDSTTGTFTKTITVNNVANENLPVWIVAAAYDDKNCMIGIDEVENFTLNANENTTKDISLTVETGKTAKYIRIFVWNGDETMKPYQAVEEIIVQ